MERMLNVISAELMPEISIRFLLDFAINMLYISEDEIYNMFLRV